MTYLLPCLYFGPIQYYSKLASGATCIIELHEHFVKQSFRNRSVIFDSNGALKLIIPLQKHAEKTPFKDIRISYDAPWQDLHWKSLESAYRSSPFFEYFEDDFAHFYTDQRYQFLHEYNLAIQEVVLRLLKLKPNILFSSGYEKTVPGANDLRMLISPKKDFRQDPDFVLKPYPQVFEPKYGFLPNLSIADLLFNEGPEAINYL
ncbi:MAG TPA: WbqC family protein [Bacteroidia bacterium]|nr:WbqC family protein [Bacteroidia bacterium]